MFAFASSLPPLLLCMVRLRLVPTRCPSGIFCWLGSEGFGVYHWLCQPRMHVEAPEDLHRITAGTICECPTLTTSALISLCLLYSCNTRKYLHFVFFLKSGQNLQHLPPLSHAAGADILPFQYNLTAIFKLVHPLQSRQLPHALLLTICVVSSVRSQAFFWTAFISIAASPFLEVHCHCCPFAILIRRRRS